MTAPVGCLDGELLPCPFCGAAMTITAVGPDWWRLDAAQDHHDDCILLGRVFDVAKIDDQRDLLIKDWNTRSASRQEGWISVEERMPPPTTYVIAHGRRYGDREGHKRVYVTYTGTRVFETVEDEEIAYWMPLPAAPQQSQEAQGDRHGE